MLRERRFTEHFLIDTDQNHLLNDFIDIDVFCMKSFDKGSMSAYFYFSVVQINLSGFAE